MKSAIIIDWIGLPYGILTDVYIFQKYLQCDIIWISCYDENRVFHKEPFQARITGILEEYDNLFFIETEFFSLIEKSQKKEKHRFYFMKNLDIAVSFDQNRFYENLELIDFAIARTNVTFKYYQQLKQQYRYKFEIKYTKFTSIDYSEYYASRNHFKVENPFKGKDMFFIPHTDFLLEEIPYQIRIEPELAFLSFGRKNLHILTDFWNKYREHLPKLYIKSYNDHDLGVIPGSSLSRSNIDEKRFQCLQNDKIHVIDKFIDEKEKMELYNKCVFFINLSPEEGYGHNINEARSTGRIIMVLDREPMNELVDNDCGIVINDLHEGMNRALTLSKEEITRKMKATRQKYLDDTEDFTSRITEIGKFR